jgi:putative redox protein
MVKATSESVWYQTQLTNGVHSIFSDTTRDKGGSESGFRPHDLLEAALASCMNITLRIYAEQHSIALSGVMTRVTLDRSNPEETIFEYEVELQGELSEQNRARLLDVAARCPVRKTLSKSVTFRTTTRTL